MKRPQRTISETLLRREIIANLCSESDLLMSPSLVSTGETGFLLSLHNIPDHEAAALILRDMLHQLVCILVQNNSNRSSILRQNHPSHD